MGAYQEALAPLAVATFDAGAPGAYNSDFTTKAEEAAGGWVGRAGGGGGCIWAWD